MFLFECISLTSTIINNKIICLFNKCSYYVNNSTLLKCFDKKYMYQKYCNISKQTCDCIQNNILYNNAVVNIKYYIIIMFISMLMIFFYCVCKRIYGKIDVIEHTNYYVIDKNDTLPKYNEIDIDTDTNIQEKDKYSVIEIPPPKYYDID